MQTILFALFAILTLFQGRLITTSKSNLVVGVQALHDNPYDGHTLKDAINQMEKIVGIRPKEVYVLNHS
ncbi:hypothetical protein LEP1GSC024_4183 [Leptospira noguchii str. 2001034031]|uniref:Uncharacterized protein n=2 Tax=Leptospira noguchii TaxID=28182 RepID=M6YAZ5_9LEPT|nr:hypothetical protein LEP1GSC024_4183 [Leptospira noguchii str. 2001034031]